MADNWEERLAGFKFADAVNANKVQAWEERLKNHDFTPAPNPADQGGTLQVFNPFGKNFDTGLQLGSTAQNALAGVGKSMTDLARGVAQKVGGYSFKDADAQKALDAPLMNTTAGKLGNIGGSVATMLPAAFIPGVNTIAGAALLGAGSGLMQPATSAGDMAANTGIGGVAGVGGNLAGRAIGAGVGLVKSTLQPFFQSGRTGMVSDLVNKFTPDRASALRNIAGDAGEIVPGSFPNAAEASQTPGLAQLVKQVQQTPGTQAQADFLARQQANNAARVAAVRTVSGDPAARAGAVEARDQAANVLYGKAFASDTQRQELARQAAQANNSMSGSGVPAMPTLPVSDKLVGLSQRPAFQDAMNSAQQLAANEGFNLGNPLDSLKGLHYVKLAIDQQLNGGSPLTALAAHGDRALTGIKNSLVDEIQSISPLYGNARQSFQQMSTPINQMDVGQALSDKLIPAINDFGANKNLRAAGFAEAMRHGDATAQRVLGMSRATMSDVMEPSQMGTLNALGRDMARSSNASDMARASGSDTVQNAISQNIIRSTLGPLGLPPSLAENTLLTSLLRPAQFAGSLAEPQVMDQLARTLLSPAATAQALLRAGRPSATDRFTQGLLRYGAPGSLGAMDGLLGSGWTMSPRGVPQMETNGSSANQ